MEMMRKERVVRAEARLAACHFFLHVCLSPLPGRTPFVVQGPETVWWLFTLKRD